MRTDAEILDLLLLGLHGMLLVFDAWFPINVEDQARTLAKVQEFIDVLAAAAQSCEAAGEERRAGQCQHAISLLRRLRLHAVMFKQLPLDLLPDLAEGIDHAL